MPAGFPSPHGQADLALCSYGVSESGQSNIPANDLPKRQIPTICGVVKALSRDLGDGTFALVEGITYFVSCECALRLSLKGQHVIVLTNNDSHYKGNRSKAAMNSITVADITLRVI